MTLILPAVSSFAEDFARRFGEGLGGGIERSVEEKRQGRLMEAQQKALELLKQQGKRGLLSEKQNFLNQILGGRSPERDSMGDQLMGNEESVSQFSPGLSPSDLSDSDILRATAIDPNLGKVLQAQKDLSLREKRAEEEKKTAKEKEYFKLNEPKVIELSDNLRKLEMEETRYNRLENLFSDPSKFPSSFTAALFSKEGQLSDFAYSQLTPEAQEALKLIIDSTSNIKDTYGAQVTNFDLQTYLKKLPNLLNTSEGKKRVLRDLQVMNRLNQLHARGIQDIFDEAGGTDKISFSTAEKRYKKKYGNEEKKLQELFVNPEKANFEEMPEPEKYLGRKIKNPETGEIFISDGTSWKPFRG